MVFALRGVKDCKEDCRNDGSRQDRLLGELAGITGRWEHYKNHEMIFWRYGQSVVRDRGIEARVVARTVRRQQQSFIKWMVMAKMEKGQGSDQTRKIAKRDWNTSWCLQEGGRKLKDNFVVWDFLNGVAISRKGSEQLLWLWQELGEWEFRFEKLSAWEDDLSFKWKCQESSRL